MARINVSFGGGSSVDYDRGNNCWLNLSTRVSRAINIKNVTDKITLFLTEKDCLEIDNCYLVMNRPSERILQNQHCIKCHYVKDEENNTKYFEIEGNVSKYRTMLLGLNLREELATHQVLGNKKIAFNLICKVLILIGVSKKCCKDALSMVRGKNHLYMNYTKSSKEQILGVFFEYCKMFKVPIFRNFRYRLELWNRMTKKEYPDYRGMSMEKFFDSKTEDERKKYSLFSSRGVLENTYDLISKRLSGSAPKRSSMSSLFKARKKAIWGKDCNVRREINFDLKHTSHNLLSLIKKKKVNIRKTRYARSKERNDRDAIIKLVEERTQNSLKYYLRVKNNPQDFVGEGINFCDSDETYKLYQYTEKEFALWIYLSVED